MILAYRCSDAVIIHYLQEKSKARTPEKLKPKFIEESPLPAKETESKPREKEHKKSPRKDSSKKESSQKERTKEEKISSPAKPPQVKPPVTKKKEKGDSEKKEGDATPSLEKKKSFYASYKARDGPRSLGSKEIPQVWRFFVPVGDKAKSARHCLPISSHMTTFLESFSIMLLFTFIVKVFLVRNMLKKF